MTAIVLCFGVLAVFLAPLIIGWFRRAPAVGLLSLLCVSLTVPYWIGVSIQGQFFPLALFGAVGLLAILLPGTRPAPSSLDLVVLCFLLMTGTSVLVAGSSGSQFMLLVLAWGVPYMLGRVLSNRLSPSKLSNTFVPVAVILAVWAIFELALNWHPFVSLSQVGGPWDVWASVQYRAGLPRSEGALGHSIVLGNILALTVPFVMASTIRNRFKTAVIVLISLGIVCTFSRMALVSLALALALSLIRLRPNLSLGSRLSRGMAIALAIAITASAYAGATTDLAGAELENSAQYRFGYQALVPSLVPVGPASSAVTLTSGKVGYVSAEHVGGVATSVDSSLLLIGLQFGWLPMAVFGALLLLVASRAVRRPRYRNPALLAAAALIPGIVSVAMITQLPYIYWMIVGLAVGGFSPPASTSTDDRFGTLRSTTRAKDLA